MEIEIIQIDYNNHQQANDMIFLLNAYACDPMGGGIALSNNVKENLASNLAELPCAFSFIAYVGDKPAALVNCFEAFSTFACKPLVNVHDIVVLPKYRGCGLSQKLLEKVEQRAHEKGCCKITLEALFWEKKLLH